MYEIKPGVRHRRATKSTAAGWVVVDDSTGQRIGPDVRYATREEAEDHAVRAVPADYHTVHHSFYGTGRVYDDQPGATQYDNGTGSYTVQIWDD